MPVNIRPLEAMAALGNQFGLVYLSLPVSVADPLERVAEVHRRMGRLKRSAEPFVSFRLLSLIGRLPSGVQRQLVKLFAAKASAVLTNVPGPRQTLYCDRQASTRHLLLGAAVGPPQYGHQHPELRRQHVRLGIATDEGWFPIPSASSTASSPSSKSWSAWPRTRSASDPPSEENTRMRSVTIIALAGWLAAQAAGAVDTNDTRMLHEPAVSADHIAFIYADDLWVAGLDGRAPVG